MCLTAGVLPTVSRYLTHENLVNQVILPTRGLFRAVRPQGPANSAERATMNCRCCGELKPAYLQRYVENRWTIGTNETLMLPVLACDSPVLINATNFLFLTLTMCIAANVSDRVASWNSFERWENTLRLCTNNFDTRIVGQSYSDVSHSAFWAIFWCCYSIKLIKRC